MSIEHREQYPNDEVTQQERREIIAKCQAELEVRGVQLNKVPKGVYEGMGYLTPLELKKRGLTQYSRQHINLLVRNEVISGVVVGASTLVDAIGITQLLAYEAASNAGELHAGGTKPGQKTSRRRLTSSQ